MNVRPGTGDNRRCPFANLPWGGGTTSLWIGLCPSPLPWSDPLSPPSLQALLGQELGLNPFSLSPAHPSVFTASGSGSRKGTRNKASPSQDARVGNH